MTTMKLDTDTWLVCDLCERDLAPTEPKIVVGDQLKGHLNAQYLEVYCLDCHRKLEGNL